MKTKGRINKLIGLLAVTALLIYTGCDYLSDPSKDHETGEKINLLVLDFNFFHTRMTYKLIDATTGEIVKSKATIQFNGKNANDIVTFAGKKNKNYQTSEGQMELTIDPNVNISAGSPFEFSVHVEAEGYNSFSRGISINNKGIKTIEIFLSKKSDEEDTSLTGEVELGNGDTVFYFIAPVTGLKSAGNSIPYTVKHSFTLDDLMKFRDTGGAPLFKNKSDAYHTYSGDPGNFIKVSISKFTNYPSGIDVINFGGTVRNALFHKLETGTLTKMTVASKEVANLNGGKIISVCGNAKDFEPLLFGFVSFGENSWNLHGTALTSTELNFNYTLATVSEEELCQTGSTIIFNSTVTSSFSVDADAFDSSNNLITSLSFRGSFPDTFLVENVPSKAVKLVFRNNNPAFNEIAPLEISNFCSGIYQVNIAPAAGYQQYQIILKAMCRENKEVAIAPTYSAEIKLKGTETWQGVNMKGGVTDVLGLPGKDYEFRLLWKNDWEYSSYSTKFDANGNYTGEQKPDMNISSKKLSDGRIQISVDRIFNQNICDELGW